MIQMANLLFIAIDLGAESGRCMAGSFDGDRIRLQEVKRFPNGPVRVAGHLHWDVLRLFEEIKGGLRACAALGGEVAGIGLDSWGVDFALLDRHDALVGNPYHYRDRRTEGMLAEAFRRVTKQEIYRRTGIQFMPINTLYQLLSMVVCKDPALEVAQTLLMIPDLFNFWLCGTKGCEFTDATTTQCYDPTAGDWAWDLLERLSIPQRIFPRVIPPATVLDALRDEVAEETGLGRVPVIAPACHDTAAAVAAVPAAGPDFAYIISGTWSLVGVEVRAPILSDAAMQANFANEGGVCGTYRFLKNVMGLWLLQECRRVWAQDRPVTYEELIELARRAPPFGPIVDPDDERFLRPTDMLAAIRSACEETGQPVPDTRGAVVRCILESLAVKYRWVVERLEAITGRPIRVIHIVGGGSRNELLCQLTADATGRPVYAGPAEATALGNALVQAMALGRLGGLDDIRAVVRRSVQVALYEPHPDPRWEEAAERMSRSDHRPGVEG